MDSQADRRCWTCENWTRIPSPGDFDFVGRCSVYVTITKRNEGQDCEKWEPRDDKEIRPAAKHGNSDGTGI